MLLKSKKLLDFVVFFIITYIRLGRLAHIRVYKVWLHFDILFRFSKIKKEQDKYIKVINDVTDGIIKEREKGLQSDKGKQTFLDNLLLEKDATGERVISNEEIRDEVNTLLFAVSSKQKLRLMITLSLSSLQGLDTTTVSLGFALSLLGIYTDIQVNKSNLHMCVFMEKYIAALWCHLRGHRGIDHTLIISIFQV